MERKRNPIWRTLAGLVLFGVSFGYVEAAVVAYLGELYEPLALELHPERRPGDLFPLITREQLEATDSAHLRLLKIEVIREAATMVMLASVALAVCWNFNTCVAAFVIAFGVWDICYYVFLNCFRPYLLMLARLQFDEVLKAKLDESDIVQQTLLEAHHSLATFRGKSNEELAAWLRRILARNLADEMRKFYRGKRDVRLEESLQLAINESTIRLQRWLKSDDETPSQCAIANEQLFELAAALLKLPPDQRRAVELHHLQGFPSSEVAKRLDRTEIAVAGLLRRGLKTLRQLICDGKVR